MSQHSPQGNLISNTTRDAIGLLHETADLFVPPVFDSVFHGAAKGVLDWAGAATNQPATSPPAELGQPSASWPSALPSQLGQSSANWLPAAPSQLGQSSASWPPAAPLVTWIPQFQIPCQPTQQASDLAALWEIAKALIAFNRELASRVNLLQESIRQFSPKQYAQANNTSTPNNMPSLNISPEVGNNTGVLNNAGLGNSQQSIEKQFGGINNVGNKSGVLNKGVVSSGDGNVQASGKTNMEGAKVNVGYNDK